MRAQLMTNEIAHDFIRDMVAADVAAGKHGGKVCTRFPPEPNGYLHIGHAKSICLNFGLAQEHGGECHLRMDDTNPTTEDPEYVAAIARDVRWLGFSWGETVLYASDYYEKLYELAQGLIRKGRAYVCDLTEEQMGEYRGVIGKPGKESPFRSRTVEENLDLFERMRKGEFAEGQCTLRAKIDMSNPNMKMRDPPLYRIKRAHHYRTGDKWCIYPLYDYAHCLSDSIEGITHSLCTMEFESARELYDWVVAATEVPHVPRQTEFARLNLSYTVMSKRRLLELVRGKHVRGWDDPRLPTIAGLRRRGVTPEAIRDFCKRIGVAKNLSVVDLALLEFSIREDLTLRSPRVLAVCKPLKVVIENWQEGKVEELDAPYWPHDIPKEGSRKVPLSREIWIEREDFEENPPKDFHRLSPGATVRLRHGYFITCTRVLKDSNGEVESLVCTYDPATRGGASADGKKVAGTIHWVSVAHAVDAEVRIYDRLCSVPSPGEDGRDFLADLNPRSLVVVTAKVEPSLADAKPGEHYQFERTGFFYVDDDSKPGSLVFNRTVPLKDGWTKQTVKAVPAPAPVDKSKNVGHKGKEPDLSPEQKALCDAHGINADEARALSSEPALRATFDEALAAGAPAKQTAAMLTNHVLGELRARKLKAAPFRGAAIAELIALVAGGTLPTQLTKDVLSEMTATGNAPKDIVQSRGLSQITDTSAVESAVDKVMADNADAVKRYRDGNVNVMGALVGMVMKATAGKANPKLVSETLKKRLG